MHVRSLRLFRKYYQVCLKRSLDILAKERDTRNQESPRADRLRQDAHHVGQLHSISGIPQHKPYSQGGTFHVCIVQIGKRTQTRAPAFVNNETSKRTSERDET